MTVADAFAEAVEKATVQGRDDVLERLLDGMAEISPAVAKADAEPTRSQK